LTLEIPGFGGGPSPYTPRWRRHWAENRQQTGSRLNVADDVFDGSADGEEYNSGNGNKKMSHPSSRQPGKLNRQRQRETWI